jgi:hypothetical protein
MVIEMRQHSPARQKSGYFGVIAIILIVATGSCWDFAPFKQFSRRRFSPTTGSFRECPVGERQKMGLLLLPLGHPGAKVMKNQSAVSVPCPGRDRDAAIVCMYNILATG